MRQKIFLALSVFFAVAPCAPAPAKDAREIESVNVLADKRLAVPLAQLASSFAQQNMVTVSTSFGVPKAQEKKIEDGEAADLFITSDTALIQQLKIKGMVDIYTIGRVVSDKGEHYTAAVVASENMSSARSFLAYLKSYEARGVFKKNGLSAP